MFVEKRLILLAVLLIQTSTSQQSNTAEDETNPLMDMASMFLQEALNNQVGGNGGSAGGGGGAAAGLAGVASLVGSFMQTNSGGGGGQGGKSTAAAGAMQILSGIGSILASTAGGGGASNGNAGNGGGFDPAIVGNVLQMFTNTVTSANGDHSELNDDDDDVDLGRSNSKPQRDSGLPLESILKVATAFINSNNNGNNNIQQIPSRHQQKKRSLDDDDDMKMRNTLELDPEPEGNTLLSLLPLAMQVMSSFAGPEGKETQERHQNHAWALPPYLENLHVLWDHFSGSDLADALYEKSGINKILKGFRGRDGKVDYDGLFQSLNNQAFRRRWIKSATLYLADWANYLATPEVYLKYFNAAQIMFNAFIKSQDYPKETFFDPNRPTETISNLFNHIAKHHLSVKIDSQQYVKPVVGYAKELLKLGQARGLLQFNATELSDKLTDTLNLEVIEPVLKVHRAYRFITKNPNCDRYILCELNSHTDQNASEASRGLISGVSSKIVKIGSMGAAIFISTETGTPFWTLFSVINSPNNCETKYPSDCNDFHVGEAEVTTEYIHNEL